MKKKIAIIGAGTGGAVSAAQFHNLNDYEVEWYYNSQIPAQAVGEGTNAVVPRELFLSIGFSFEDLSAVDGTPKMGISKYNWGQENPYFIHDFIPSSSAYHFNAVKLQQYIMKQLEGKIKITDKNVTNESIDADYIVNCSGKPKSFEEFNLLKCIPVNSVYVTQCFWPHPRFNTTLTIAMKHGWVFGIPLTNRCSIGYLYNNNITSLEEIKEEVKEVFKKFDLTPSDTTNAFSFNSYYRKTNFTENLMYNGNASFFLEPLEATSIGSMMSMNQLAIQYLKKGTSLDYINYSYKHMNLGIAAMISLHYFAGSKFKTPFWDYAETVAQEELKLAMNNVSFKSLCKAALRNIENKVSYQTMVNQNMHEYGSWGIFSFTKNIAGLGIKEKLSNLIHN